MVYLLTLRFWEKKMDGQKVELRKFPYPYRAALAISNDLDNTPSLNIYLAIMDYLNGNFETPFGKGLALEAGNSMWFFNMTSSPQLSYFKGDGMSETDFAPHCRDFLASGHIDTLHTYGDYDEGGFSKRHAEISLDELIKQNAKIKVWVNHGSSMNTQNLGFSESCNGAKPDKDEYHNDLLNRYGVRYAWMGRMTHILGQDARQTLNVKAKNVLQRLIFDTRHKHHKDVLYDARNRLLIETELQDGNKIWDFQRWVNAWGREQKMDINDLASQLKPANIKRLLKNEGFLIVYTHVCEGLHTERSFPKELKKNLENISKLSQEGCLLVTTTSRLLQYAEVSRLVTYETTLIDALTCLTITPFLIALGKKMELSEAELQGLTFYCEHPEMLRILFRGKEVDTRKNLPDHSGRRSISIPWVPLEYPRH